MSDAEAHRLLNCPFCGGQGDISREPGWPTVGFISANHSEDCYTKGWRVDVLAPIEETIERWNSRIDKKAIEAWMYRGDHDLLKECRDFLLSITTLSMSELQKNSIELAQKINRRLDN